MTRTLRIGTRGSKLALWQAEYVRDLLAAQGTTAELVVFSTRGDRQLGQPLPEIGGKGLFTQELEEALFREEIDLAVHSCKDLPVDMPEGLTIVAMPKRADPRDALVLRQGLQPAGPGLDALPRGAVVGTSSPRRRAQLLIRRPDVQIKDVRGNVDTRLRKLDEGQYDALLLASAGLDRLGFGARITVRLDDPWLPAPAQGAIAIQGRVSDEGLIPLIHTLEHRETRLCVEAERALLKVMEAGCSVPLAAYATLKGERLTLDAAVTRPDGGAEVRASRVGEATAEGTRRLGRIVARELREHGADEILRVSP